MDTFYNIAILRDFLLILLTDNFLSHQCRVIKKLLLETKGARGVVNEIGM